jgi:hypothetical protein
MEGFHSVVARLVSAYQLDDDSMAKGLLPRRKDRREIVINHTANGVLLVHIGCNVWAFEKATDAGFLITLYLENPRMFERYVEGHMGGYLAEQLAQPTVATPVPRTAGTYLPESERR